MCCARLRRIEEVNLAGQFSQKFLLGHAVFKGFAAIDKDYGNFVGKLPAQLIIRVHIHFAPGESAAAMHFADRLFHDFAEVTSFTGINHDFAGLRHAHRLA